MVLANLDVLSLVKVSVNNKILRTEAKFVAKLIVKHLLREAGIFSRFVCRSELGDEPGQVSYLEMMWRITEPVDEVLLLGGGLGGSTEVTKMILDQDGKIRFEASTPMLRPRAGQTSLYFRGEIFAISADSGVGLGHGPLQVQGTMERMDKLTQTQTHVVARMPNQESSPAAAIFDNKLVSVGGYGRSISCIMYTLAEHTDQAGLAEWCKHEEKLKQARWGAAALAHEDDLFVCGGDGVGFGVGRGVQVFDSASRMWEVEKRRTHLMIKERKNFSLFVFEDELYAVAGDVPTTIEKRDKTTKRWQIVAELGQNRLGCTSVLVDSKIFLFGGGFGSSRVTSWDFFDIRLKAWASQTNGVYKKVSSRQLPRSIFCASSVLITPPEEKAKATWTNYFGGELKPKKS